LNIPLSPAFSLSEASDCPEILISIFDITTGTEQNIDAYGVVFTFANNILTVNTADDSLKKTYTFKLVGTLKDYESITESITLTVKIYDSCDTVTITT
jgi:hypothetical protein